MTERKTHNFEIVDKIYEQELDEFNHKQSIENRRKLRLLNSTIQERIQKGTELNNTRKTEDDQKSEKDMRQRALDRMNSNMERVE